MSNIPKNIETLELTEEMIKAKYKKAQIKNILIVVTIIVVVFGFFKFKEWSAIQNLDYIDGNELRLTRSGTSLGNVWKNESVSSNFVFASLFETDANFMEINSYLGKEYNVSDDGLTITITLNDDLKWSDGTSITAEDIIWSIETFLLNNSTNLGVDAAFTKIKGADEWMEVGLESWENGGTHNLEGLSYNGNVITIVLETPYPKFMLATTQFIPLPKHILQDTDPTTFLSGLEFFEQPVCSGMYMYDSSDPETGDITLIHNPHYSREYSEIERVVLYGDYENMHVSMYPTSTVVEMVSYRSMPGFDEFMVEGQFYRYFVFNMTSGFEQREMVPELDEDGKKVLDENGNAVMILDPTVIEYDETRPINEPMQDIKIRQAISLGIDRAGNLNDAYFGQGTYDHANIASQEYTDFLTDYNPTLASQLLLESGYDLSRPLTIGHYHTDPNTMMYLTKVEEQLEAIGFEDVIIKRLNSGDGSLYIAKEYDMYMKAYPTYDRQDWYNELLTINDFIHEITGADQYDEVIARLNASTTEASYNAVWKELQDLDQSLMYKLPLYSLNECTYINANRVSVPEDMQFCSARYRCDLRLDEWYIKKS